MIENINEEKLEELLNLFCIKGSNIGVHHMSYDEDFNKTRNTYKEILKEGFIANGGYYTYAGLTSKIVMCGLEDNLNTVDNIIDWHYGDLLGKKIKIVFAIPEIICCSNGKEYYIGEFPIKRIGKDKDSMSFPYSKADTIPKEFILGYIEEDYTDYQNNNVKRNFIINRDYIGLMSEEDRQQFYDKYEDILKSLYVFTLDEKGYQKANFYKNEKGSSIFGDTYYINKFLNKYNELYHNKTL